jgi:hypothetical protein
LAIRLTAGLSDLGFDEIWTLALIDQHVSRPLEILTGYRVDNNHPLNTLWMYSLGPRAAAIVYRLPSILCGTCCVPLAFWIGSGFGRKAGIAAAAAVAGNYLLASTSSEARGYGAMTCFLLVAIGCLMERGSGLRWRLPLFWAACIGGMLSHLTFLSFYAGSVLWSGWMAGQARTTVVRRVGEWGLWHGVPLAVAGLLYAGFARHIVYGGGPKATAAATALQTASVVVGGPLVWPAAAGGGLIAAAALAWAWWRVWRQDRPLAALVASATVVAPALLVMAFPIDFYNVKYFLAPAVVALLCLAVGAFGCGPVSPWICGGLMAIYGAGNGLHLATLVTAGHGGYRAAIARMIAAKEAAAGPTTVASSYDFRTRLLLDYHAGIDGVSDRFEFVPKGEVLEEGTEWIMHVETDYSPSWQLRTVDVHGNIYEIDWVGRSGSVSPGHMVLYRRTGRRIPMGKQSGTVERVP